MDAQGAQVSNRFTFLHVRALDLQAHALEHLRQGTHGDAADPHQMGAFSRDQIGTNIVRVIEHRSSSFLSGAGRR